MWNKFYVQDRFKLRYLFDGKIYDVELMDFLAGYVYFKEPGNYVCTRVKLDLKNLIQSTGLKDNTKWENLSQEEKQDFYNQVCSKDGETIKYKNIEDVKHLWNGKLIFEGDICRFNWNPILNEPSTVFTFVLPVEYYINWACFAFHIQQGVGKQLKIFEENNFKECWVSIGSPIFYGQEYSGVEIIGNIYQNGDLLYETK